MVLTSAKLKILGIALALPVMLLACGSDEAPDGDAHTELDQLSDLESLDLNNNRLSGCVPSALQDQLKHSSDLGGLPFC